MEPRAYRRFVILSSPRCGTHMLRTSFAHHPSVVAHTELFNPDWNRNEPFDETTPTTEILARYLSGPYPASVRAVGFALHRSGARFGPWTDLWARLEADTDLRVISLRRCDLLRRYVSFCLMRERSQSGLGAAFTPAPRAYHPEELQAEFERAEQELAAFDARFAAHPLMPLTYEQLRDDYPATLRRIHAFLSVRPERVEPTTVRNSGPPMEELITNFAALASTFAPTRWSWFFRDSERARSFTARGTGTVAP